MLAIKGYNGTTAEDVADVSITFEHAYYGNRTFNFYQEDPVNSDEFRSLEFSPTAPRNAAWPSDIESLTITLENGQSVKVLDSELACRRDRYNYYLSMANADAYSVVTFMWQPAANLTWTEFAIRVVETGETLGTQMPGDPEWTANMFLGWEQAPVGSGVPFDEETPVTGDLTVYARKETAGGGVEYRVLNNDNSLYQYVADLYNEEKSESVEITEIIALSQLSVVGEGDDQTNPLYFSNGWNDAGYYYIYNLGRLAVRENHKNTRVPPDEVTALTGVMTLSGGTTYNWSIPRSELVVLTPSGVGVDAATTIRVRGDADEGKYDWYINYYLDDQVDQTESGQAEAGTTIDAQYVDDYSSYLALDKEQNTSLTVSEQGPNVLNLYWYTDNVGRTDPDTGADTGDGKPDIWQFKVTYAISDGTWDGTDDSDKVFYVTKVDSNGNPAADGTATLGDTIPSTEDAKPNSGYTATASWDVTPSAVTEITSDRRFVYSFEPDTSSVTNNVRLRVYKNGVTSTYDETLR